MVSKLEMTSTKKKVAPSKKKLRPKKKKLRDQKNKSCGETSSAATILGSTKGPKSCGIIIKCPKKVAAWEKSCGILNVHFDRHRNRSVEMGWMMWSSAGWVFRNWQVCNWVHRARISRATGTSMGIEKSREINCAHGNTEVGIFFPEVSSEVSSSEPWNGRVRGWEAEVDARVQVDAANSVIGRRSRKERLGGQGYDVPGTGIPMRHDSSARRNMTTENGRFTTIGD
ncbi:hypothetical protein DFH07DRAFT_783513 [Mycena maculata]|uniref:Uncharacterized protein n=1 Tax=Mycena maculata TaxID=230809 RepID=A0AAD7HN68_9AGAR|nr:hypothetical protein DFH07DRAFT_783513 [Mycena maculata]